MNSVPSVPGAVSSKTALSCDDVARATKYAVSTSGTARKRKDAASTLSGTPKGRAGSKFDKISSHPKRSVSELDLKPESTYLEPNQIPRKKRATDVLKLSNWLTIPAAVFARGLSLPEKFGRASESKYDWDGWVCSQLSPDLWKSGGWWTWLAPACVATRAASFDDDDSTVEDVKNDLVRLILHNVVARCCGFDSIQELGAEHKARIRPTAADHAKDIGAHGGSKVTLGLLIELALALYAFGEHHREAITSSLGESRPQESGPLVAYTECIAKAHRRLREKRNSEAVHELQHIIIDLNSRSEFLCIRDCHTSAGGT